ncbi:MAG: tetratricopeptide repeat protein [Gemmatimonadetes bacterium]|nr:tetratricopeptide repeat protein [Gemmatimonadota bacterium]
MNKSDQRIRKFNPGTFQPDDEVKEQFVVRKHELEIVLKVLSGVCKYQHALVVASRGQGKTMLLARVAAEIRTDDKLSACLLPIRFMEESHEIFNIVDFWLDTLFYLARESTKHDPVLAEELRKAHADLAYPESELVSRPTDKLRETHADLAYRRQTLADHARAAVLEAADRLGKKLVLMVENLQELCENVDKDFGRELRDALQSEPQIMLLATATSRLKGLDDVGQPFLKLLKVVKLKPLKTEACRDLWQVVSGDAVSEREIRPLEILTGGNPRLLVIVAGFAQHRSLNQLMEDLVKLIDEHTDYFRSHLEALPKSERRVYLAVIDFWRPAATLDITARARMDVRTVSTMLGRLVDRGIVSVEGSGKKRQYAAAERLYSIYYKLRRERDEAAFVANLIHFMKVFYSASELAQMFDKLNAEATRSPMIREGIKRAYMEHLGIDQTSIPAAVTNIESVKQLFEKASAHEKREESEAAIEAYNKVIERFGNSDKAYLQLKVTWALTKKSFVQVQCGELEAAIKTYDEVISRFGDSNKPQLQEEIAWALVLKGTMQVQCGELEAAIKTYDEAISRFGDSNESNLQLRVAHALAEKSFVQVQCGELEAAIKTCDEVISQFSDSNEPQLQLEVAHALSYKGDAQKKRGELEAAIKTYDEVISQFGDSNESGFQAMVACAMLKKGKAQSQRGELEAEIEACDRVISQFGDSNESNLQLQVACALAIGGMIHIQMGRAKEALHTCEALERRPEILLARNVKTLLKWRTRCVRTRALMLQEKRRSAMDAFRSAYDVFVSDDESMMDDMQKIVPDLIATGASERDLVEILSSDRAKSSALAPLIVALQQSTGEKVRPPVEVFEVAKDILKRIKARVEKGAPVAS